MYMCTNTIMTSNVTAPVRIDLSMGGACSGSDNNGAVREKCVQSAAKDTRDVPSTTLWSYRTAATGTADDDDEACTKAAKQHRNHFSRDDDNIREDDDEYEDVCCEELFPLFTAPEKEQEEEKRASSGSPASCARLPSGAISQDDSIVAQTMMDKGLKDDVESSETLSLHAHRSAAVSAAGGGGFRTHMSMSTPHRLCASSLHAHMEQRGRQRSGNRQDNAEALANADATATKHALLSSDDEDDYHKSVDNENYVDVSAREQSDAHDGYPAPSEVCDENEEKVVVDERCAMDEDMDYLKDDDDNSSSDCVVACNTTIDEYDAAPKTSPSTLSTSVPTAHAAQTSSDMSIQSGKHTRPAKSCPFALLSCLLASLNLSSAAARAALAHLTTQHSVRYGEFLQTYLGVSYSVALQERRRARNCSAVGLSRPFCSKAKNRVVFPIRPTQPFRRHSVLAVEGDALFTLMIARALHIDAMERAALRKGMAECVYEQTRVGNNADRCNGFGVYGVNLATPTATPSATVDHDDVRNSDTRSAVSTSFSMPMPGSTGKNHQVNSAGKAGTQAWPAMPNARCIVLHYGLDQIDCQNRASTKDNSESTTTSCQEHNSPGQEHSRDCDFARTSLIAVVCTTRLEAQTEIRVSLSSYTRCMDEVAWYEKRYTTHCHRIMSGDHGSSNSTSKASGSEVHSCADAAGTHPGAFSSSSASAAADTEHSGKHRTERRSPVRSTLHSHDHTESSCRGIHYFTRWPQGLSYYHGVGHRHRDRLACASFPFTLVELCEVPELGAGQMGLRARCDIPYATCFLYGGPAAATSVVEAILSADDDAGASSTSSAWASKDDCPSGSKAHARVGDKDGEDASQRKGIDAAVGSNTTKQGPLDKPPEQSVSDIMDWDFVKDDTYALGLGQDAMCFGQGLARYINHRYNFSRYGNCELCTLMLSVPMTRFWCPGGLSLLQSAKDSHNTHTCNRHNTSSSENSNSTYYANDDGGVSDAEDSLDTDSKSSSLLWTGHGRVKKKQRLSGVKSSPTTHKKTTLSTRTAAALAQLLCGGSLRNGSSSNTSAQRGRRIYLENHGELISVPFFITTTDITSQSALLAWSYGEEYDAKLERVAVTAGLMVPYSDAAVLHEYQRDTAGVQATMSGRWLWQRYGGDYRYALMLGDIVWRRQPFDLRLRLVCATQARHHNGTHEFDDGAEEEDGVGGDVRNRGIGTQRWNVSANGSMACPLPEEDLFVLKALPQSGAGRVLLQPLTRMHVTADELRTLLPTHRVSSNAEDNSKHAMRKMKSSATDCDSSTSDDHDSYCCVAPDVDASNAKIRRDATCAHHIEGAVSEAETEWAVFAVPADGLVRPPKSASHSLAHAHPAAQSSNITTSSYASQLQQCVIATTDTLAPLFAGAEYVAVNEKRTPCGWRRDKVWYAAVDVTRLRAETRLVRESRRATKVAQLCAGTLWPLFE